jgi:uncharacterized membrane protein
MILHQPGEQVLVKDLALGSRVDNLTLGTGYCLIPWAGVMAAGYGFGALFLLEARQRRQQLLGLGVALTATFILLRAANVYGDPSPRRQYPEWEFTVFSFLNCTKYPASLLYVLMTLGPSITFLGLFDGVSLAPARPLIVFGRVPLFYYLLHIPLIHGSIVLLDRWRYGMSPQQNDGPWAVNKDSILPGYGVSLPMVYLIWIGVLLILYLPCLWFAGVKRRYRWGWLSYL